jgi:hypothetical protein
MIDDAERMLRQHGFTQLRVRHHDDIARIELMPEQLPLMLSDAALRAEVATELTELGYTLTVLDLRGFRSGSLNEVLTIDTSTVSGAADSDRLPHQAPLAATRHGQILVVQLECAHISRLTDTEFRARFVQQSMSTPDVHYVALQLTT